MIIALKIVGVFIAGVVVGMYVSTEDYAFFPRKIKDVSVLIEQQSRPFGPLSLQLNINGRAVGWIAMTPNVREYLTRRLEETK